MVFSQLTVAETHSPAGHEFQPCRNPSGTMDSRPRYSPSAILFRVSPSLASMVVCESAWPGQRSAPCVRVVAAWSLTLSPPYRRSRRGWGLRGKGLPPPPHLLRGSRAKPSALARLERSAAVRGAKPPGRRGARGEETHNLLRNEDARRLVESLWTTSSSVRCSSYAGALGARR